MLQCTHEGCAKQLKSEKGRKEHQKNGKLHQCPDSCRTCREIGPLMTKEKPCKKYMCQHSGCSTELSKATNRTRHEETVAHFCKTTCELCEKQRAQAQAQAMLGKRIELLLPKIMMTYHIWI
jgi:hypothetical protein